MSQTDSYRPSDSDLRSANDQIAVRRLTTEIMKQDSSCTMLEASTKARQLLAQGIKSLWS